MQAHFIKDRRSSTARAVFALQSSYKWALSGTPLQNRVGELYSLVCKSCFFKLELQCVCLAPWLTYLLDHAGSFFANPTLLVLFLQGL